ncbi:MAG: 2-oxo acid dehydrogenase subunit E2 [Acidobacteria bacterium]|nr:2-oxo acid dehydrogenase subunit E2 [Acidobacteriota bacterium]
MGTAVVMPQMGESIAEGTIVRWIKKVGDYVDRDEPLFEISTDKVDAEIPSPAAGVLTEIRVREGETVAVDAVVGTIGAEGDAVAPTPPPAIEAPSPASTPTPAGASHSSITASAPSPDDMRRQKSSPLVRRIAKEHNLDITSLSGSGIAGRVTKQDILGFLESKGDQRPSSREQIQPLSVMRRKIAEHMVMSRRTSAHVHTVFHVNFSTVEGIRKQKKADYERVGAKLTYMAFIAKAVVDAIRRHPIVNASLVGDNVVYKKDVNLGIAVALEGGLIVPVVKNADEKNLLGLARAITDVADRARAKQLKPEEVHGGTFTITNPGQFGAQFGMPIINQPQVAILGVGTIEKRPVVIDDAIAIQTMAYLTLGFDHRLVDGAVADEFIADIRQQIEHFDPRHV